MPHRNTIAMTSFEIAESYSGYYKDYINIFYVFMFDFVVQK